MMTAAALLAVITPAAPSGPLLALWAADLKTLLAWAVYFGVPLAVAR